MLGGPILVREWLTTPRRFRFHALRAGYPALLFVLLWTAWQALIGFERPATLGETSRFAAVAFPLLALIQLALVLFSGSLHGAGTVAIEKERKTFVLLLVTRMTSAEIVVDKFLSALLHSLVALAASAPILCLLALMGGVSHWQIVEVLAATLGAALFSIALGVLIAVWREKAFQAVALTMLGVVSSLVLVELLIAACGDRVLSGRSLQFWLTCLSPVRSIADAVSLEERETTLLRPALVHLMVGTGLAALCLGIAVAGLRKWNPRGEPVPESESHAERDAVTGRLRSRRVWNNPVLWREVRTRAYGTRPVLIKLGYLAILGVLTASLWLDPPTKGDSSPFVLARAFVPAMVLSLLLINAQALASVTAERDLKSIDLLLVTDVRPAEFVFGKLWGSLYNAKEMLLGPIAMFVLAFSMGWIGAAALVLSTLAFGVFVMFAAVLGLHAAMRYETSRLATANSLGTMFLLFVGVLVCMYLIVISGRFEAQWASFIVFIVLGSIGLWISLSANHPTGALSLAATLAPMATFYAILAFIVGDRLAPFLVVSSVYGFAVAAMMVPMLAEFDVATGRTTVEEG